MFNLRVSGGLAKGSTRRGNLDRALIGYGWGIDWAWIGHDLRLTFSRHHNDGVMGLALQYEAYVFAPQRSMQSHEEACSHLLAVKLRRSHKAHEIPRSRRGTASSGGRGCAKTDGAVGAENLWFVWYVLLRILSYSSVGKGGNNIRTIGPSIPWGNISRSHFFGQSNRNSKRISGEISKECFHLISCGLSPCPVCVRLGL